MSPLPSPRFLEAPAMLLAGIRRHHRIADAPTTVPAQWQEFRAGGFRDTRAPRAFGVMCGATHDSFEYMTALEVENFERLPADIGRMRVPQQHYAVFRHDGHVSSASATWEAVMTQWLPASDYVDAVTPAFELYNKSFNPDTGNGGFEIWFPVKRKHG